MTIKPVPSDQSDLSYGAITMSTYHKVTQGECLSSIARTYGFTDYLAIYNNPGNALLKRNRPNPNILYPGDTVFIPDKQQKQADRATSKMHVFQIPPPSCLLRLRLYDEDEQPYANKRYVLEVDDNTYKGRTSPQGLIEQKISGDAATAKLELSLDEDDEDDVLSVDLTLGYLDPIDQISGVQARLNNLGFSCGTIDGIAGAKTEQAVRRFQRDAGLEPTGKIDSQTCAQLTQCHDTMTGSPAMAKAA
jgi:N-acetylmuramoyl-L-alanine amidase